MSEAAGATRDATAERSARGGRLCGAVRYEVSGPLRQVVACHCETCRRTSGHFAAATATCREALVLQEDRGLRRFDSSATARRGFCQFCGSNLFRAPNDGSRLSIMAGTLDKPTGLAIAVHIFVNDAGDYYRIADGVPQRTDGEHGIPLPPPS
jgi:hypothetical protein